VIQGVSIAQHEVIDLISLNKRCMRDERVQEFCNKADDLFRAGGNESAENEH
jgi:hypothetical protein